MIALRNFSLEKILLHGFSTSRLLLMKDESVLKHLLQQEAKKRENVRIAENKINKLAEQLQATEKILNANKMFLKKLQEQVTFNFEMFLFPKVRNLEMGSLIFGGSRLFLN